MKPKKSRAIIKQQRRIEGWFEDEAVMLFALIDEIQKSQGITGNLFEIGAHHGRSAVCLAAMAAAEQESLNLCDIFNDQQSNVSGSGSGDLAILEQNLLPFKKYGLRVKIHKQNSMSLNPHDLDGPFRFFHIDGGHNVEEALSDLKLAAQSLLPPGVIVLDDPFQPGWPGVTEALIRFLDENSNYCAVAVGYNKLLLANRKHAPIYADVLRSEGARQLHNIGPPYEIKELPFHGDPLIIFYLSAYLQKHRAIFRLRKYYRSHKWLNFPVFAPVISIIKKLAQMREPN